MEFTWSMNHAELRMQFFSGKGVLEHAQKTRWITQIFFLLLPVLASAQFFLIMIQPAHKWDCYLITLLQSIFHGRGMIIVVHNGRIKN